jgi:hypothetical protein
MLMFYIGEFHVISGYLNLNRDWAIHTTSVVVRNATTIVLSAAASTGGSAPNLADTAARRATDIHAQRSSVHPVHTTNNKHPLVIAKSCILPLVVSSIFSVAISFSSWGTRATLSATQFTVLGLGCKLATVVMNFVIWDDHAPLESQGFILVCIFASLLYSKSAESDKAAQAAEHAHAEHAFAEHDHAGT